MAFENTVRLHCDTPGCGSAYQSMTPSTGTALTEAQRTGWSLARIGLLCPGCTGTTKDHPEDPEIEVPDGRTMVYVAGPMSGLPNYNFDAFHQASRVLRARGFAVQNPADDGVTPGFTHSDYMRRALRRMMLCTEVFLLPGWQDSRGATIEHDLAVELGMPVHYPEDWMEDPH